MSNDSGKDPLDYLVDAYDKMLDRVHTAIDTDQEEATPRVKELYDNAIQKAVDLGELTREEAAKVGDYVQRDVDDVAHWLTDTEEELVDWFRFDVEQLEARALAMFKGVADRTILDMRQFNEELKQHAEFHTGQVTGLGTLVCRSCGKEMHFYKTGRIPPCSQCKGTVFDRKLDD